MRLEIIINSSKKHRADNMERYAGKTAKRKYEQIDNIERWRMVQLVDLHTQLRSIVTIMRIYMAYDVDYGVSKRDAESRRKQREVWQIAWVADETALNKIKEGSTAARVALPERWLTHKAKSWSAQEDRYKVSLDST